MKEITDTIEELKNYLTNMICDITWQDENTSCTLSNAVINPIAEMIYKISQANEEDAVSVAKLACSEVSKALEDRYKEHMDNTEFANFLIFLCNRVAIKRLSDELQI